MVDCGGFGAKIKNLYRITFFLFFRVSLFLQNPPRPPQEYKNIQKTVQIHCFCLWWICLKIRHNAPQIHHSCQALFRLQVVAMWDNSLKCLRARGTWVIKCDRGYLFKDFDCSCSSFSNFAQSHSIYCTELSNNSSTFFSEMEYFPCRPINKNFPCLYSIL